MKIERIELTKPEMNQAIQEFLAFRNINLNVIEVSTIGYPVKGWEISVEGVLKSDEPAPPIQNIEQFGKAIEAGTV